jgi:hypothetical protein
LKIAVAIISVSATCLVGIYQAGDKSEFEIKKPLK